MPRDILVWHETPKDGSEQFFRIIPFGRVHDAAGLKHHNIGSLAAWLDKHDYRFVCGSKGHWRLP